MTNSNDRKGRAGSKRCRRGQHPRGGPGCHEAFTVTVERFRRFLAGQIARRIWEEGRQPLPEKRR
jgi:hypothetical protein